MSEELPSLDALDAKIKKAQGEEEPETPPSSGAQDGMRISIELVAGVLVGAMLGYGLDTWFSTKPLFLLICVLFGFAGSMLNIYRYLQKN